MKPLDIFASLVAFAGTAFAQDESPTIQVFSKDSFWYKPIPADAPLHENSENFVKEFLRQKKAYYGTVAINTKEYASPVYIVDKKVPKIDVGFNDPRQKAGYVWPALVEQWKDVPLPAYAEPADGTDQELTLYQPSTDTIWEFWLMRKVEGKWVAAWGGKMEKASKNDGIFPDRLGTTATSLPFLGGQITAAEMKAQRIDHVMGIALVDLEHFSVVSWPASRSDGYNPEKSPNRIPEGLRFRLDPSVDVEALQMHPIGKAIARAAQKYGFVIWDKAGAITLRAENPKGYTLTERPDPYPELFGGTPQYSILNGFPWDKLQFLPMNYGKPRR
ncbi:MAG TPA: hypothetical protein VM511_13045 [Luteolibacter sp.]|nr:hypothetical protein [Luteolibacter sp.]